MIPLSRKVSQAVKAEKWLMKKGVNIKSMTLGVTRPCIEIEYPPLSLSLRAIEIIEFLNGRSGRCFIAELNGCRIVWR